MRRVIILPVFLALGGCGLTANRDARLDYQQSTSNYKACLMANPTSPQRCDSLRLIMETDERKYAHISAATGDGQSAGALTVLNR